MKKPKKEKSPHHLFSRIALSLIVPAVIAGVFFDVKLVMIVLFSLLMLIAFIIHREKCGQELLIAFLIAFAWTSFYRYEYKTINFFIGNVNLFPLICWTFGLLMTRELYKTLKNKYRFALICIIYVAVLLAVEFIGYHVLKVQLNSNFTSLLGLGVIHGTLIMKLFYILAGPVYILITDYLNVKYF